MKDLKHLSKEYDEVRERVQYLDSLGNPSQDDLEEKERLKKRSNEIMKNITELRHCSGEAVNYTVRSGFTSGNAADDFGKRASMYRFYMDSAKQAERTGDIHKADSMRVRAIEYISEMTRNRRSGHRTITTQTTLCTSSSQTMGTPRKNEAWSARQREHLDRIEKRLNHLIGQYEQPEGDGSLQIKRPAGPAKR